jgi:exonuclease III
VSILFRKGISFDTLSTHKSSDGRKLLVNISIDDHPITVMNVYAPNNQTDRCALFKRMQTWVSQHANTLENLILCGYFNCVLDNSSDKSSNILKKCLFN